jgi:nitroreductase
MKNNPQYFFFKLIRYLLSIYFGIYWKLRYALRMFGIENTKRKSQESWNYDQERFLRYASTKHSIDWPFSITQTESITKVHFQSIVIKNYHAIEKAMALRQPRDSFGQKSGIIDKCIQDCESYMKRFGNDTLVRTTYDVLHEYRDKFGKGYAPVERFIEQYRNELDDGEPTGGTQLLRSDQLFENSANPENLFSTRHSIRDYSDIPVPKEIITKAAEFALQGTPSVCNRQPARLHVYSSPGEKANILNLQNGNRGFGDQASHILIVTSSLESFVDIGERNECWTSGGMFAMSLIYALHTMKIASCGLNWDVLAEQDKAMHLVANIPSSEVIVMLIAIGYPSSEFRIAKSERKNLNDIVFFK